MLCNKRFLVHVYTEGYCGTDRAEPVLYKDIQRAIERFTYFYIKEEGTEQ